VRTDAGNGFVKSIGNPQGDFTLASELVSAELGTWFGLKIPPFAVVSRCDINIPIGFSNQKFRPPLFFSMEIDGAPRDGGDTFLKRLFAPMDVAKLVVFDTWIRNADRHLDGTDNSDNLLYARSGSGRKYDIVPIDHSHCFINADLEAELPADEAMMADERVYGFFPEFGHFITNINVSLAVEKLATLDPGFVDECVNSVPREWGLGQQHKKDLADLICQRAKFVAETLPARLVNEPYWLGLGG
jgi:hypothetical protein